MLKRYETLLLAVPEVTQDETKNLESELDRIIRAAKGTTISFERWGKYKLTYPVKRNDYGVYFLMRFEVPQNTSLVEDMKSYFAIKRGDVVMRYMTSNLDLNQSLAYQRPKSLEESPASRDVDSFLKEHKMEGLLSAVETKRPAKQTEPEKEVSEQNKEAATAVEENNSEE